MDYHLLEILACPICYGKLVLTPSKQELVCRFDQLAWPVRDGIPVLLESEARLLTVEEKTTAEEKISVEEKNL